MITFTLEDEWKMYPISEQAMYMPFLSFSGKKGR
jgi:hypothetical protein